MTTRDRLQHIKPVLDLIEADPAVDHSVVDLATAAGVAPRTLQKRFKRALGKTPRAVIREARLARARRELLAASVGASVTEIATRCGFTHLGRFAVEYRAHYGEPPSSTLQRRRVSTPAKLVFVPMRERPTVAVMPFAAIGTGHRLALGIAEELAVALSRVRSICLVAPDAARFQLHGSVRGDGRLFRATLRFVEMQSGRLLWAVHHDGNDGNIFALEERIATHVATTIEPSIRAADIERVQRTDPAQLSPRELALRALPAAMAFEPSAAEAALELLDRAMELDRAEVLPVALAAWCHAQRAADHFTSTPEREKARACELAGRACGLDQSDPLSLTIMSGAHTLVHDLETADTLVEKALLLEPSSALAWGRSGWLRCYRGESAEATERFQIALELAPNDLTRYLNLMGLGSAQFRVARYPEAVRWWRQALVERPGAVWLHRFIAPALALCGRTSEAHRSFGALLAEFPELTITEVRAGLPLPRDFLDRVAEGLESLGMPHS